MKWFFGRLTESSSYPSIGLIGLGGQQALSGNWEMGLMSVLSGLIGFIVREKGTPR